MKEGCNYEQKSFTVKMKGGKDWDKNWDRIFKKKEKVKKEK